MIKIRKEHIIKRGRHKKKMEEIKKCKKIETEGRTVNVKENKREENIKTESYAFFYIQSKVNHEVRFFSLWRSKKSNRIALMCARRQINDRKKNAITN